MITEAERNATIAVHLNRYVIYRSTDLFAYRDDPTHFAYSIHFVFTSFGQAEQAGKPAIS